MIALTRSLAIEAFWSKVDRRGPIHPKLKTRCWVWTASTNDHGYGKVNARALTGEHPKRAHRVAWEISTGPIPPGKCVLHHCDNPACVRPLHLFIGTKKDNTDDMMIKRRDRHLRGEAHQFATISDAEIVEIRREVSTGVSMRSIARRRGVSHSTISRFCNLKGRCAA